MHLRYRPAVRHQVQLELPAGRPGRVTRRARGPAKRPGGPHITGARAGAGEGVPRHLALDGIRHSNVPVVPARPYWLDEVSPDDLLSTDSGSSCSCRSALRDENVHHRAGEMMELEAVRRHAEIEKFQVSGKIPSFPPRRLARGGDRNSWTAHWGSGIVTTRTLRRRLRPLVRQLGTALEPAPPEVPAACSRARATTGIPLPAEAHGRPAPSASMPAHASRIRAAPSRPQPRLLARQEPTHPPDSPEARHPAPSCFDRGGQGAMTAAEQAAKDGATKAGSVGLVRRLQPEGADRTDFYEHEPTGRTA